jgi:hypothetical protein
VRSWSAWRRVPGLGRQTTAAGFAIVLLAYTVPVPGVMAYAMSAAGQSSGTAAPPDHQRSAETSSGTELAPEPATPVATATPTPTPTATPTPTTTPVSTSTPAPPAPAAPVVKHTPTPPPPPPPPASTCSASVKFPTPAGGEQTVYVTSNVPNMPVSVVAHYKTTTHPFTTATDGTGHATMIFSIGSPTPGYPVLVTVTVGSASCSTSFTPQ